MLINITGCLESVLMNPRILIIEDDEQLSRLLRLELIHNGFEVSAAFDGAEGMRLFHQTHPDLVIADVGLPIMDGVTICQRIREVSDVPILLMTADSVTEEQIANALNLGADEFMLKPLGNIEFHARVRALLRRARLSEIDTSAVVSFEDQYLRVDLKTRRVTVAGTEIRLTPTEFRLLAIFIRNAGEVISFRQILERVWGFEYINEHHYPRIYVSHLRRKIEPDAKNPTYIVNEYGVGYRFVGSSSS